MCEESASSSRDKVPGHRSGRATGKSPPPNNSRKREGRGARTGCAPTSRLAELASSPQLTPPTN